MAKEIMLKSYFEKHGIKYSRWARDHGINPSILCRFLKGEIIPNTRTLIKISAASGLTFDELLGIPESVNTKHSGSGQPEQNEIVPPGI